MEVKSLVPAHTGKLREESASDLSCLPRCSGPPVTLSPYVPRPVWYWPTGKELAGKGLNPGSATQQHCTCASSHPPRGSACRPWTRRVSTQPLAQTAQRLVASPLHQVPPFPVIMCSPRPEDHTRPASASHFPRRSHCPHWPPCWFPRSPQGLCTAEVSLRPDCSSRTHLQGLVPAYSRLRSNVTFLMRLIGNLYSQSQQAPSTPLLPAPSPRLCFLLLFNIR